MQPHNGLGIAEGGAFEKRQPKLSTNVELPPSAQLLKIPCW